MDSIDTDSGDLVEMEVDIDEDVLLVSDSHSTSDNLSESNEIDNLLDKVNDLSDRGSDSDLDTGGSLLQNDTSTSPCTVQDSHSEDESDEDLALDIDDLQDDPRTCDEMFDVLMKDPEWSTVFKLIHVNQFTGPSRPTLPPDFDLSSNPVNYFQLLLLIL